MRKATLILAAFACCAILASCGKKMTEEQIAAAVQTQFDAQSGAIATEATAQCDAAFSAMVTAKTDSLVAAQVAAAATATAEAAAAKAAAAPAKGK